MRGKSARGAAVNPPRVSASPGTIKKYMIQEGGRESPGKQTGTKSKVSEGTQKNGLRKQLEETENPAGRSETSEEEATMETRQKNCYLQRVKWRKCLRDWKHQ